jgi:cyclin B
MEFELQALRTLISEKTQLCNQLKKEVSPVRYIGQFVLVGSSNLSNVELYDNHCPTIFICSLP